MKVVNYFIRMSIVIFMFIVAKSSSDIKIATVENNNVNKTVNLTTMAMKIIEVEDTIKYTPVATYTGDLTGYAYNCPLCNGTLGCMPKYNIKDGTTTYKDYEYGEVKIVASSKNIACGSIIRFKSDRVGEGEQFAIVLDRGVGGYALDLLTPSEEYASKYIGRSKITYDVLRSGWE